MTGIWALHLYDVGRETLCNLRETWSATAMSATMLVNGQVHNGLFEQPVTKCDKWNRHG